MSFEELVTKRYAVKLFDKEKKISASDLDYVIRMAILAPTSYGLQPFRIKVISDDALKKELEGASWNQSQITSCSHLLVFCADDNVIDRIEQYGVVMREQDIPEEKVALRLASMKRSFSQKSFDEVKVWAARQTYFAADHAMLAAVEKGFNSCPMEGFDKKKFDEILELPSNLHATILVPLGYPADTPRPKLRFSKEDLLL